MKLTQTDRKDIVAAIQTKQATMTELAERYGVTQPLISHLFKTMTGRSYYSLYKTTRSDKHVSNGKDQLTRSSSIALDEVVHIITKLSQANPKSRVMYNIKENKISIQ